MENVAIRESLVVFRSSQGAEIRANLLRLTRHLAVFEVYNPASILQTSEVLSECKIVWQDRTLYAGRAIVRNLISTGLVTTCEATLEDSWLDVDLCLSLTTAGQLNSQFNAFLQEWQKIYRVMPDYKVVIADLQTFLTDVRLWLDQVELGIRSSPSGDRAELEKAVVRELEQSVVPAINNLFERFEVVAQRIEPDMQPAHRAFGKRQLHPLLLCSPFVYRTFQKPLGYAGDYEMVNMMFRDPCEGSTLFAKMVNTYALQLPPIVAHRNRIVYLKERLLQETRRVAGQHRAMKVFNLGCGPAHEIQQFLAETPLSNEAQFSLADFNDETLAHTQGVLSDLKTRHGRRTPIQLSKKSVHHMLKQGDRRIQVPKAEQYDLVYCAGLFDYLSDKVCRKLMDIFYDLLAPGGLLIATNVDNHSSRNEMEYFLEWNLIHRNTAQMTSLTPGQAAPDQALFQRDPAGINIFMEVRKPNGE